MKLLKKIFGKSKQVNHQDIRGYLQGNLDVKKTRQIEEGMLDNDLLSNAVDGFDEFGVDEMNAVPSFDDWQRKKKPTNQRINFRKIINWLLAFILLICGVIAIRLYWEESTPERLYAQSFNEFKDPELSTTRDGMTRKSWSVDKKEAITSFQAKAYGRSILYWEKVLIVDKKDFQAIFYLGLAYLHKGEVEEASRYLTEVSSLESSYQKEALWYLALAQLKDKDKAAAKVSLEGLMKSGNEFYKKKAEALLEKL